MVFPHNFSPSKWIRGSRNSWIFCTSGLIFRIQDFLLARSGILGFEMWNSAQESGNTLPIGIRNPSSSDKESECITLNPESTVWNPESKTVLDSLSSGEQFCSLSRSPPVLSSISVLTNSRKGCNGLDPRLVIVEWNQILFQEIRIRIFFHWLFPCRCTFRSI